MNRHTLQIIVIIVIFFISVRGVSQTYEYLDENSKEVSSQIFYQKCNSSDLYNCLSYKYDGVIISKILYRYQFGKISKDEFEQLRKLIINDSGIDISPSKIIVLKKYDSILSYKREVELHKQHEKYYAEAKAKNDSFNQLGGAKRKIRIFRHDFNKDIFNDILSTWLKETKKCIENYERKFNIKMVFLHQDDPNLEKQYKDFKWLKDRGIFKQIFFKNDRLHYTLILKPNGEYFLAGTHFKTKNYKKLIKNDDWSKYLEDFEKSINGSYPNGKGIFKNTFSYHHSKRCF